MNEAATARAETAEADTPGADTAQADRQTIAALRQQLEAVTQEAERLRQQLEQVRTSTSWRVMGPYRVAGRLLKQRVLDPFVVSVLKRRKTRDFRRIARSRAFNAAFYLGRETAPGETNGVIMDYLVASQIGVPRGRQNPGMPPRRPMLGFHQLAYAAERAEYDEAEGEDPLAHYLRTGQPEGPWKHDVILPHPPGPSAGGGLRIAIHAHFHYPDLLADLLHRLRRNTAAAALFITTTSEAKAAEIGRILNAGNAAAKVVVVPNRGRDIGPLLVHFPELEGYDIVGHLHGKRSPQQTGARGENWRDFLWTHLVGGESPIMDVIAAAFAADPKLGLIFPEDPNLNHWDMNQDFAGRLAERMGRRDPLPNHFEFPKGTMFWVRPAALRPLAGLGWDWMDFPAEPVASDGTVLHALERLIPFAAEQAGFGFKAVHVPHCWRMPEVV